MFPGTFANLACFQDVDVTDGAALFHLLDNGDGEVTLEDHSEVVV